MEKLPSAGRFKTPRKSRNQMTVEGSGVDASPESHPSQSEANADFLRRETKKLIRGMKKSGDLKWEKPVEKAVSRGLESIKIKSGSIISSDSNSKKYQRIIKLIAGGLEVSFNEVGLPQDDRNELIHRIANELISRKENPARKAKRNYRDILKHKVVSHETAVAASTLPSEAPIKWKDREPGETAPDFARRVYGPYGLANGIPKRVLRKLDAALVNELNTWARNGNEMPADIQLLTKGEENDRLLNAGPEAIREHLGKFTGREALREAERLRAADMRKR